MASDGLSAAASERRPAERTCEACGYQVVEFRPLAHCPMCGAVPAALWQAGILVAAPAA